MTFNMKYTNKQGKTLSANVNASNGLQAQKQMQEHCLPGTVAMCSGCIKSFMDNNGEVSSYNANFIAEC